MIYNTTTLAAGRYSIKFRGLRHGVSNKIHKQLQARERIGELLLVDINEFKTSKVIKEKHT